MFGLSVELIVIISATIGLGGVVKGVTGIGLPIFAISVLVNFLDPLTTFTFMVIPILVTNLWQAATSKNWATPFRRFPLMIATFVVCLMFGVNLAVSLNTEALLLILGISVVIFSAANLIKPHSTPLSPQLERYFSPVAGALGGLLGGLTTIWGPPMMMLFVMLKLDKNTWVQTVGVIWFIGSVPFAFAYWYNGLLNAATFPVSCFACLPAMIGIWFGENIRRRINQKTFRKIMLTALIIIGLNLIRRAVF